MNKLVLTRFDLSVCQQCRILTLLIIIVYIMLCCDALLCLLQDSLFKSPFSLKSAGGGDKKILKYIKANLKLHLCYNEHVYLIL